MALMFLRGQTRYMQARNLDIHAISSPGKELDAFGSEERVTVHPVRMPRRITPIQDLRAILRLGRTLLRIRPTIVHAHTPKGGLLGMTAAWLTRTPVRIYHIHGMPYMTATGRKRVLLKTTERISCLFAHRVFCVSHSIHETATRDGICRSDKIVVPAMGTINGVDAAGRFDPARCTEFERAAIRRELGAAPGDLVIGFVGRLVRDKGIAELACAWRALRSAHPRARLVLVGPLEPQDPIDPAILEQLEADERVHLAGSVPDTSRLYAAFDVVVLPSYREGFPNVPLEAAAMALPVVATRIPGCIDAIVDGETGTLVPSRDADALQKAIACYLVDPALRRRHGQAGRERVLRDFRQEDIWRAIHQEYLRLLADRGVATTPPVTEHEPA
jgi:glycosyltransferase involved in cell wall biosynthesis